MVKNRHRVYSRRRRRPDIDLYIERGMRLKGRYWIEKGGKMFLASGRIELLENINRYKSITRAAREMGISYRNAWMLVDQMNRISGKPLVKSSVGGKKGGGSFLTEAGKSYIALFYSVCEEINSRLKPG